MSSLPASTPLAKSGQSHEKLRHKYSQGRCQNQVNSQKGLLIQRIIAVCDFGMLIRTFGLRVSLIVKELRKARKTLAPYVFAYFLAKLSAIALLAKYSGRPNPLIQ